MGETVKKRGRKPNANKKPIVKAIKPKSEIKADKITAYMASFPSREESIVKAIESLIGQVDELVIATNGEMQIPSYPNVKVFNIIDKFGDIGCAGKFIFAYDWNGYILTVDDDFVYPKDYVSKTIEAIEKYERKAVISWHGRICDFPIQRYKGGHREFYQCTKKVEQDHEVNILGTGVMGFHSSTLIPNYDVMEMRYANCSDILFSISLDMRDIKMIVPEHEAFWISPIYNQIAISFQNQEEFLVPLINSYNWKEL